MFNQDLFRVNNNIIDYSCYCPKEAPLHGFTRAILCDSAPIYIGKELPKNMSVPLKDGEKTSEYLQRFTQLFCGKCIKCGPLLVQDPDTYAINLFPKRDLSKLS